ncbi:MAG TPA: Rne/Rng family ribonuclease, partial [Rhizobiales bacterium]|nr:Rne/Rng family ribonuclease [Hyphomicrobiales bacterium]
NTDRGGGISRKITNIPDRKRLKETASSLNVPGGMGVIIRTAGANRTKAEIKRDYEYLLRLWENIRDLTLKSIAPCLVYEEGNLIKRSIRDLYNRDVEQVLVEGEAAYKQAKGFMKMLMPSHAKNVQPYKDKQPLFVRYHVENQLDAMFSPIVTLPSGGYLVINQAEALVAIDVNSGKATRKHSIEETARQTNTEAAEEIARQLRLRDLAGLIVIDFIDMEEKRNNRAVERRLKEKLKSDRARIQVGRISHFGLLEMSRQRLRSSMLEGTTNVCPHCQGTGLIRSVESSALHIMRAIEMHALNGGAQAITVNASPEVTCYVLNRKRQHLSNLESRFDIQIYVEPDDSLVGASSVIRKGTLSDLGVLKGEDVIKIDSVFSSADDLPDEPAASEEQEKDKRSPRRRRRRKPRSRTPRTESSNEEENASASEVTETAEAPGSEEEKPAARKRRRGKRGGRKHNSRNETNEAAKPDTEEMIAAVDEALVSSSSPELSTDAKATDADKSDESPEEKPKTRTRRTRRKTASSRKKTQEVSPESEQAAEHPEQVTAPEAEKPEVRAEKTEQPEKAKEDSDKPKRKKPAKKEKDKAARKSSKSSDKKASEEAPKENPDTAAGDDKPAAQSVPEVKEEAPAAPKRKGWWSSRFSAK